MSSTAARARRFAVVVAATTFLTGLAGASASAGECKINIGGFGIGCGHALNKTTFPLRIASIVKSGGTTCTVRDTGGKVLDRNWRCESRSVRPGAMSPVLGGGQDVDAITFDRSFKVNEHPFKAGEWVKIKSVALCVNLWGSQPHCYTK
ncbi:hypothetical protein GCM10022247_38370 [Allokutzneria multivorans]|uniref:Secreted protein n=1 Tax=Allokutzneria multivorans TaxID=1142134 RepID=A0ABP7SIU3_9PSEU